MPIGEAVVHIECDRCEHVTDPVTLTALARGGWDTRDVPEKLRRDGWRVEGKTTICPDCVREESEKVA